MGVRRRNSGEVASDLCVYTCSAFLSIEFNVNDICGEKSHPHLESMMSIDRDGWMRERISIVYSCYYTVLRVLYYKVFED